MPLLNNLQSDQKEGRMALAIQAYNQGHFSSGRSATDVYDVSKSTFRSRVKGVPTQRDLVPRNRKLTTIEESTLVQ
jgi:helix-turn-helix, Psq domain